MVGRIRTRGRGRVQPYPRLCAAHVPSRSDESDRAHEPLLDRSKPFYDISVSKRCALLGPFSCALRACSDARDHNTTIFSSPKGEGFRPSPEETLKHQRRCNCQISDLSIQIGNRTVRREVWCFCQRILTRPRFTAFGFPLTRWRWTDFASLRWTGCLCNSVGFHESAWRCCTREVKILVHVVSKNTNELKTRDSKNL